MIINFDLDYNNDNNNVILSQLFHHPFQEPKTI